MFDNQGGDLSFSSGKSNRMRKFKCPFQGRDGLCNSWGTLNNLLIRCQSMGEYIIGYVNSS